MHVGMFEYDYLIIYNQFPKVSRPLTTQVHYCKRVSKLVTPPNSFFFSYYFHWAPVDFMDPLFLLGDCFISLLSCEPQEENKQTNLDPPSVTYVLLYRGCGAGWAISHPILKDKIEKARIIIMNVVFKYLKKWYGSLFGT